MVRAYWWNVEILRMAVQAFISKEKKIMCVLALRACTLQVLVQVLSLGIRIPERLARGASAFVQLYKYKY